MSRTFLLEMFFKIESPYWSYVNKDIQNPEIIYNILKSTKTNKNTVI